MAFCDISQRIKERELNRKNANAYARMTTIRRKNLIVYSCAFSRNRNTLGMSKNVPKRLMSNNAIMLALTT